MDILNSEGPILTAKYTIDGFVIYDITDDIVDILSVKDMQDFIHGKRTIKDDNNKMYDYGTYPGSMKPDLKSLDEFIGINTNGKSY